MENSKPALARPVLGELPTDHQELMNIFYDHWQAENARVAPHVFNQIECGRVMPEKVNVAVCLGNMNSQVGNGGFTQYHGNGYDGPAELIRELYEAAARLGIENADRAAAIVEEFMKIRDDREKDEPEDWDEDHDDPYDHLDTRFYDFSMEALNQAVLDRLEELLPSQWAECMK